jgi:hypothetical protein
VKSSTALCVSGFPLLVLASIVLAPVVYATPPTEGSGDYVVTSETVTSSRADGGNVFDTVVAHISFSGVLSGTSVTDENVTFHPNGKFTGNAIETFGGTANGIPGTIVFRDVFAGNSTTGAFEGRFTTIEATGELADLHGEGTFQGATTGTYRASLHFES